MAVSLLMPATMPMLLSPHRRQHQPPTTRSRLLLAPMQTNRPRRRPRSRPVRGRTDEFGRVNASQAVISWVVFEGFIRPSGVRSTTTHGRETSLDVQGDRQALVHTT